MRKTRILLLAGVVLPAFAIAAPSFVAPSRAAPAVSADAPIVVAQADDDKQQRREEKQQRREERQQERSEPRQERSEQRQEQRQDRQEQRQPREDRQPREERSQPREDRSEQRQQRREEKQQRNDGDGASENRQRGRDAQPERNPAAAEPREDKQDRKPAKDETSGGRERPDRPDGANRGGADAGQNDRGGGRLQELRDRDRNDAGRGGAGTDPQDRDRPGRDGDKNDRGAQGRDGDKNERGGQNGDRQDRNRGDAGERNRDGGGRLQELREERRDRDGDRPNARDERRDDRRDDARQQERNDRLQDRIRDERRDARDDRDRLNDRIDRMKDERKETRDGTRITITEPGGRRIIRDGDRVIIRRDETARFRFGVDARNIREERRGGEIRTVITRPDGSRVITITDEDGRLLRRIREQGGREYVLIDNRPRGGRDGVFLNLDIAPPRVSIPRERYIVDADVASRGDIEEAFDAPPVERLERSYSLDEIRQSKPLREYVRSVDLDSITFDTGSWDVRDDQISKLEKVGQAMEDAVKKNPRTVFMVEGHTDAVGSDDDNLSLSDRRAESVAEVLTKYFDIPAENLTTQGYGEQYLKVPSEGPEERNRRVTVRNITPLLTSEK